MASLLLQLGKPPGVDTIDQFCDNLKPGTNTNRYMEASSLTFFRVFLPYFVLQYQPQASKLRLNYRNLTPLKLAKNINCDNLLL